ncbi:probable hexosyltransferase MUCI70 [Macadamia integrifolia]|uniref:probable hexosyltransferase MUCI70 n=1 Tax=Macadamia integrifolia TaxID=60698 RepID=UPI001C4ECBCD|nr:probable hexosyltransferase MUCI70 [Macadamia integrifolia]
MGRRAWSTSLLFQSKSFCFSLLYLFTTLFLALYSTLSTKCIFRSSPFNPIQKSLFSYPPNYGEHKYAIPTLRSSCNSPVFFSDYSMVLDDIKEICMNSSSSTSTLSYLSKKADSFAGNFSTKERIFYFDHRDDQVEVPCGVMKEFPVSDSDRIAMESCKEVVVISAIFGDHDKIRQPRGLGSKTLELVCFIMFIDDLTLEGLQSHNLLLNEDQEYKLGVWRIVKVSGELPYENPAMNGVIPKHLPHRLFPNSKFSIWLDAKLQLMVDPLLLIHSLVISENVDMAISKHPYYVHTMEEAMATVRWKKWGNVDSLKKQMEVYCQNGLKPWTSQKLPYTTDVPDSALILRRHGSRSNLFSCLLFNELEAFNPRDQLAFAYVRDKMKPKVKLNMFEVEVFEQIVLEFRHNLKKHGRGTSPIEVPRTKWWKDVCGNGSSCNCSSYLLQMWRESHD